MFLLGMNVGHEVASVRASPMQKFALSIPNVSKASARVVAELKKEIAQLREGLPEKVEGGFNIVVLCFESRVSCRKLLDAVKPLLEQPKSRLFVVEENNIASSVLGAEKPVVLSHVRKEPRLKMGGEEHKKLFYSSDLYLFALEQLFTVRSDASSVLLLEEGTELSSNFPSFLAAMMQMLRDPSVFSVSKSRENSVSFSQIRLRSLGTLAIARRYRRRRESCVA